MPDRPYLAQVEEFFIATIRKGLMLRAHDVDVIRDWEARGVPLDVVRRGISTGIHRFLERSDPTSPLPSSLKYYRTFVEAEFERYCRASSLQRTYDAMRSRPRVAADDPVERAFEVLARLAGEAATPGEARRYESAAARLRDSLQRGVGPAEALDDTDDFLVQAFLDEAPPEVRRRVEARVHERLEAASRRGLGPEALADVARAETRAAAASESGFEGLVARVLGSS